MRTLRSLNPYKILVVDDQREIHEAFQNAFVSEIVDDSFDNLESSLFGDESVDSASRTNASAAATEPEASFDLSHATQGAEAVVMVTEALAAGDPFELAFVDMRMPPGIDGLETIDKLWQLDRDLQVVVCTAYSDYSWTDIMRRLGTTDNLLLLKKPFAQEEAFQQAITMSKKRRAVLDSRLQFEHLRRTNENLCEEIEHRQIAERMLYHAATHDHLTKLPNRTFLKQSLSRVFSMRTSEANRSDALIFLDIDNFKYVNDSLGHSIGDELLVEIGDRLLAVLRGFVGGDCVAKDSGCDSSASMVARLGGDEFVIFLAAVPAQGGAAVKLFADQILEALSREFSLSDHTFKVGASLGIAFVNDKVGSPEVLMRNADLAMYRAKSMGKHCVAIFDEQMHESVLNRVDLESALQTVLVDGGLRLEYQPIFSVTEQTIIGLESLVRWDHPTRGLVSPIDFIPLAEETGMIVEIGRWIISEACRTINKINELRDSDDKISISVNVSKRQLVDNNFIPDLIEILGVNQVLPQHLNLEITESLVIESPESVVERLHEIRSLGISLHMDDFGTGHSSLSCLHRFPIDVLKIDRSFISTMQSSDDYESIVQAIITLAHSLGATVIAEGIETEQQFGQLRQLACDFGQGFWFSHPKPIHDLAELLAVTKPRSKPAPGESKEAARSGVGATELGMDSLLGCLSH